MSNSIKKILDKKAKIFKKFFEKLLFIVKIRKTGNNLLDVAYM